MSREPLLVPNSAGTSRPRFPAPGRACDCHLHIYDPRFPMAFPHLRGTAHAGVAEYRLFQRRIGTARAVVVQPAAYGTDNNGIVAALHELGPSIARGIAVVHPNVSDAELRSMQDAGVRGLRFTQHDPNTAITTPEMIEPLTQRVAEMGWHVQLHLRGDQIVEMAALIDRLPGTLVIDHMGRIPHPQGIHHPAFALVKRWLGEGRTWVKLSGPYLESRTGSPQYADITRVAREYVKTAPGRLVWGSDWPHPTEHAKPDDAVLFDLLREWAQDEAAWRRILVDNPETLYGF